MIWFKYVCYSAALLASAAAGPVEALPQTVVPLLEEHCAKCHDAEKKKGDVSFDFLADPNAPRQDVFFWGKVREQLRAGTMPPKEPLTPEVRDKLLAWISENEKHLLSSTPTAGSVERTRRLNRDEFNNVLRDLLGISSKPGDDFPSDGAGGEGFTNAADTLSVSTLLVENYFKAATAALAEIQSKPALKERFLPNGQLDAMGAEKDFLAKLAILAPRAFRRPVEPAELEIYAQRYRAAVSDGTAAEEAGVATLKALLVSPKFLFLEERTHAKPGEVVPLDHWDMAWRLSFLLWSSLPDAELNKLAAEGRLQDAGVLAAQVTRMLADPKADAFVRQFAGQWFRVSEILTHGSDRNKYPEFRSSLRNALHEEAVQFLKAVFLHNGRALDCLDADYSFLNERLANYYGVPGITGDQFRKVTWPGWPNSARGGLTTMGAVLATTSYPRRTSPVLRGKWVMEQLLGVPPPPPPPEVGELPKDDRDLKDMTLRKRLEAHRDKPNCRGCHVRLDPPGFALENFDPIGRWRDQENGKPIDASGRLPSGEVFDTPAKFRRELMAEKSLFVRNLCRRLLGYALERALEPADHVTLLQLERKLEEADYHTQPLLIALVQSQVFRSRRGL